jgi:dipeptidyl aminopeptidase/acylaminoacyl peptidase
VGFLERTAGSNQRLVLGDLRKKSVEPLTSATETIRAFDIRERNHYVYTVADPAPVRKMRDERQAAAMVGTGRSAWELFFPEAPLTVEWLSDHEYLRAVVDGKRFEVKENGTQVVPTGTLMLSPSGRFLVTTVQVSDIPSSWETLYPPPFASFPHRIYAGRLATQSGSRPVHQYVLIDLQRGSVRSLTDAPTSSDAGWWAGGSPSWSSDGQEILLPGTFLNSKENAPSRPCVAVVNLSSNARTCVEMLKGETETGFEEGYHGILDARFAAGDKQRVMVSFRNHEDHSYGTTEYRRTVDGTWQAAGQSKGEPKDERRNGLEVTVKQGLNEPPVLVATNRQTSRVLWDPNPQLKDTELGEASVYTWKDKEGRERKAGLYKPLSYRPGQRYPLVIQTHGFEESKFVPSGVMPTAFAARALAAAGIVVLQTYVVGECTDSDTPDERPCKSSAYEAVANHLVAEGLVDPERIGIIGFSASCALVMDMITTKSFVKAASVTDGIMADYFQYMLVAGMKDGEGITNQYNSLNGAEPFGEGLQQWLKRSPGFNLDRVTAPLLVVGEGPFSLLTMWQPYAGLYYLHKPVDLILLNSDEHVLTKPAVRMASQGGSVDWFRFWLQDYEDPEPAKAEQYKRWRELRKMQSENEKKSTTPQSASN